MMMKMKVTKKMKNRRTSLRDNHTLLRYQRRKRKERWKLMTMKMKTMKIYSEI